MLLTVLALAVLLTALGWYVAKDVFAPYVACPGVWLLTILIYYVMPSTLYPVCHQAPLAISLWMVGFFVSALLVEHVTPNASAEAVNRQPNALMLKAYFVITLLVVPIICGTILWQAFTKEPETMFRYMRIMNVGIDDNIKAPDFGPLIYFTSLAFVTMFFAYMYFKSKWAIGLVVFMNLLYALITMSKTVFLSVIFSSLYFAYIRKVIRLKHMAIGICGFVALSFLLQSLRSVDESVETNDFLSLYLSSSMVAFDYFAKACSSVNFGENTFRLFYAIGHSLGLTAEPVNVILAYVSVPEITNTYTGLYPFYTDFGYTGVFVFSIIYGVMYGYLYKKSRTGGKSQLILYSIFLTFLLLEFLGEFIFTNLSMFLQYVFFAIFPFMIKAKSQQHSPCIDR